MAAIPLGIGSRFLVYRGVFARASLDHRLPWLGWLRHRRKIRGLSLKNIRTI